MAVADCSCDDGDGDYDNDGFVNARLSDDGDSSVVDSSQLKLSIAKRARDRPLDSS